MGVGGGFTHAGTTSLPSLHPFNPCKLNLNRACRINVTPSCCATPILNQTQQLHIDRHRVSGQQSANIFPRRDLRTVTKLLKMKGNYRLCEPQLQRIRPPLLFVVCGATQCVSMNCILPLHAVTIRLAVGTLKGSLRFQAHKNVVSIKEGGRRSSPYFELRRAERS